MSFLYDSWVAKRCYYPFLHAAEPTHDLWVNQGLSYSLKQFSLASLPSFPKFHQGTSLACGHPKFCIAYDKK